MGTKKYTLKGENVNKCIKMGITVLKIVIWEVNCGLYGLKIALNSNAPL